MYYFYILYSERKDCFYYGHSANVKVRLKRHNEGWSSSTKSGIPWKLVFFEEYKTKSEAIKREMKLSDGKIEN